MSLNVKVDDQVEAPEVYVRSLRKRPMVKGPSNLAGVIATGAGAAMSTHRLGLVLWIVRATAVTTGGTVLIEGCEKDSSVAADWYTIATVNITATGTKYVAVDEDEAHMFMRSNLTVRTDGTYSVQPTYRVLQGHQI